MRYAYHHLGERAQGTTVVVRWKGGSANVLLLDPVNFTKYRESKLPVAYSDGGLFQCSPARLTVPQDGRWYVVADLRGFANAEAPTIEVFDQTANGEAREEQLATAIR